jgi:hypothetical protein
LVGFIAALENAQKAAAEEEESFLLGILEVVPLGVRFLWLKGEKDLFVPVRPVFFSIRFKKVLDMAQLSRGLRALQRMLSDVSDEP